MISSQPSLTDAYLRTPRAAAFAGIIFSVLWVAVFGLMRLSVPPDPFEEGAWLAGDTRYVALAMNLVPFAGIAFLWFVGVLRDRLGAREDQFFATVFLGSGFLLLAMLFVAAAVVGAIIVAFRAAPDAPVHSATFHFGRGLAFGMINIYLVKTAAVHDHDVDHCHLHRSDAALARDRGIRHRGRTPDWKFLFRLEPARVSVVGFVG
jgi:hypothetical protein